MSYNYRRIPEANRFSVEGSETGYLIRMCRGKEADDGYITDEYYQEIKEELRIRGE